MQWLDIEEIVDELEMLFPCENIIYMPFTKLKKKILELEKFTDNTKYCNEKILEAIQEAWIERRSENISINK
ncbi:Fe-S cluster assembly protein IscX [Wolbachia endosymbiont of Howardula sp.]|uniref:Fe-S cluster assembly protein IscX n=1 Tax=Wolbachia endosymbiont of Howardula sp. TaxID=2916816 RepID=UPI00217D701E|nr:Fe-S cluster assembly protein IscX [Wolbachia endosymbiont of Howardula sp.]UWI83063.1 Fe-S cluster assembly protein IscX [Wolbachia endosymbiont of Howardula sp.]